MNSDIDDKETVEIVIKKEASLIDNRTNLKDLTACRETGGYRK